MSIISYPYTNYTPEINHVEVVDAAFSPIMVTDVENARRQGLVYKAVAVALFNHEKKFFIVRRNAHLAVCPGLWDFCAAELARASEAWEEAAQRALAERTGLADMAVRFRAALPYVPGSIPAGVHLFTAGPARAKPALSASFASESMFLDHDELLGLKETFPEMLTPWLGAALDHGMLDL